jgi:hypothetical protein
MSHMPPLCNFASPVHRSFPNVFFLHSPLRSSVFASRPQIYARVLGQHHPGSGGHCPKAGLFQAQGLLVLLLEKEKGEGAGN